MSRFELTDLPLAGLKLVRRKRLEDTRGHFARVFCSGDLTVAGWQGPVAQINHSFTQQQGSIRGMHFQLPPQAEQKLVSCLRGAVWDVAIDIRADSPTFLRWHAEMLTADGGEAMLIPQGFAHGFQTISDNVELLYCHSAPYAPASERGISPFDPRVGVDWPELVSNISDRDRSHPPLTLDFEGVSF